MEFTRRFEELGLRPALIFPDREPIFYAELTHRIAETAQRFGSEKKLVAIMAEPTEHAVIAYLAALHGNHAVVLLPPCTTEALDDFIADFSPDIVCRRVGDRWRFLVEAEEPSGNLHPDLAVLLSTSGSTGKSQYVRLSDTAIQANAEAIACYLELDSNDRAALILPFHYSYGLSILNSHLVAGASVYFPGCGASDAGFAEEMRAACCTNISGVPYSFEQMEQAGFRQRDLPSLRFVTVAGGRMRNDLAETFARHLSDRQARFFMMYGQTEATARIAYVPPEQLAGNVGSIGIAIPGGSLWLADEHGNPIHQDGETGELVYSGPNVMMGYACERNDLAKGPEISELRTGDMATRDVRGFYHVVGRRKRMSKIAGLRLSHEAIEFALDQAGIPAAVVGGDDRLLALVTSGHTDDQVLKIMMAASGLPRPHFEVDRVQSLPRLVSGKVDYVAVLARLRQTRPQPHSGVLAAFRNAFYPRQVNLDDTFEGLGGESLLYVQLSLALESELGRVPEGWETIPLSQLSRTAHTANDRRSLDTQLVLRAMSILLVVIHHATLWPIPGGAAVLVMLVGYSLARFKRQQLYAGDVPGVLRSLAAVLAPYALVVAGFSLARGEVLWPSVFLVGNLGFVKPPHMMPFLYWFVEAYVQIVLLWLALFCILPLRAFVKARPFIFGVILLILSVAAKFLVPLVWNIGGPQIFTLPDVFYLTVLGWCVHFATSRQKRLAIMAIVALLCPLLAWHGGNWVGSWVKFMLVLGAVFSLLYVPRITVPARLVKFVLPVSAASYHIYLFHRIVPEWLLQGPDAVTFHPLASALAISIGMISGLGAFALQGWVIGSISKWKSYRTNSTVPRHQ
jgi:acyl-CoA synthetase (AMP-forming)/AMP-acid ligase II